MYMVRIIRLYLNNFFAEHFLPDENYCYQYQGTSVILRKPMDKFKSFLLFIKFYIPLVSQMCFAIVLSGLIVLSFIEL